jgi:hypothetical protein
VPDIEHAISEVRWKSSLTMLCEHEIEMIFRYEMRPRVEDPEKLPQPKAPD